MQKNNKEKLNKLKIKYEDYLLNNILPFWEDRIIDEKFGGYFSCFKKNGDLICEDKAVWFVGRNIYIFSRLINVFGYKKKWMDIIETGLSFSELCFNPNGHMKFLVNSKGESLNPEKSIFTEMFFCQGLIEFLKIDNSYKSSMYCQTSYKNKIRNFVKSNLALLDDKKYLESYGYDYEKSNLSVSFIRLMVAYDGLDIFDFCKNYIEIELDKILYSFASDINKTHYSNVMKNDNSIHSSDDLQIINPGHSMEALSISYYACKKLNRQRDLSRCSEIVNWIVDKSIDSELGGYYLNLDESGTNCPLTYKHENWLGIDVSWDDKIWWVQFEILHTLLAFSIENDDLNLFEKYFELDNFIDINFYDKSNLEFYGFLNRDCSIKNDDKGSLLKGPYHIVRSYLEIINLIEKEYNNKKENIL